MNAKEIVIVDYDCITPLGNSLEETYRRIKEGESGVKKTIKYPGTLVDCGGEIENDWRKSKLLKSWGDPVSFLMPDLIRKVSENLSLTEKFKEDEVGIFGGCGLPGVLARENLQVTGKSAKGMLSFIAGVPMAKLFMEFPFSGESSFISTSCTSGGSAILSGASQLKTSEQMKVCLVCCWDFPIHDIAIECFSSSRTLFRYRRDDRAKGNPSRASRPFSVDRAGFLLSEALGIVALTTRETAEKNGLTIKGAIKGGGSCTGAINHTGSEMKTLARAIGYALNSEGCKRESKKMALISSHGTSTHKGDEIEAMALASAFGNDLSKIPLVSTQEFLGHTFGTSMLIQTMLGLEMLQRGEYLPMRNYLSDPNLPQLNISTEYRELVGERMLVTGIGFGGYNLVLSIDIEESRSAM